MYYLFFVLSFSIAKNAEWTWTEFYWRTFHSETRVSSEDSRSGCFYFRWSLFTVARLNVHACYLHMWRSPYDFIQVITCAWTSWTLRIQKHCWWCNENIFVQKKSFFWILTLIYLDILGYLANTCNLLLIATFCYATILLNEIASGLEWPQGLISREMVIVSKRLIYFSFVCGVTLSSNSLLFSIVNLFSMFSLKSKEHQIKQLELELDQERRMAESLVEDMVIK